MEFELKIDNELSLVIPNMDPAPAIFNLINKDREYLRKWLPWVDQTVSVKDTENNILDRIETFKKREAAPFYAIYENRFIGSVGFVRIDKKNKTGDIGYWLTSELQGQGLMTRYVKACIKYGFEELKLDKIIIKCAKDNYRSAAIPQRLGFKLKRTHQGVKNDKIENNLIFELPRKKGIYQ